MRTSLNLLGAAALLAALAGCGGSDKGAGGLSAEDERELDNAAAMLDQVDQNNIDVSADSLVANEAAIAAEENQSADANAQ